MHPVGIVRTRSVHARQVDASPRSAVVDVPDLAGLVAHYQDKLRLRDWRINITYAPDLASADGHPVWGLCYPTADAKVAKILIRDPNTPPQGVTAEAAAAQVVETVVHELVHLHFAAFCTDSPEAVVAEEQAVWALAEALVKARGTNEEQVVARAMLINIDNMRAKSPPKSNQQERAMGLSGKMANEAVQVLTSKDGKGALALIQALLVASLGGEEGPKPEAEEPAPEAPPAQEVQDPPAEQAAPMADEDPKPEGKAQRVIEGDLLALARQAVALSGKTDPGEAIAELARRSAVAVELEARERSLAEDRAKLEGSERRQLVATLVKIGVEIPATAWGDDKGTVPCKRLADEPIADLRARVALLSKTPDAKARADIRPPAGTAANGDREFVVNGQTVTLSARELDTCRAKKIAPEDYAKTRAGILARSKKERDQ